MYTVNLYFSRFVIEHVACQSSVIHAASHLSRKLPIACSLAKTVRYNADASAESFQTGNQISLTGKTDHFIFHFAALEEKKGWNIADPKPVGKIRTFVHIDFRYFDNVTLFFRDLIQYSDDHTARAAPGSREID